MTDDKKRPNKTLTIILCFLVIFCGLGIVQPRGLFVVPVTTALGISRSAYAIVETIRSATAAILSVFFGFFVEKFCPKILICAGFIAYATGELAFAFAENVILLYVGGFFLGVGMAWTSTAIVGYLINRVCDKHRGTVLGLVFAANGIGGAVFAQVFAPFLAEDAGLFGYRKAYYLAALILAAVLVLIIILFRNPKTTNNVTLQKKQREFSWEGISFNRAKKTIYFYLVCACVFITGFSLEGLSSVRSAYMQDIGFDMAFVAVTSSVGAVSLAVFKFVCGFIYEKTGLRVTVIIANVCALLGIILLLFLTDTMLGRVLSITYSVVVTVAFPLETVILPIYTGELFGEKSFGKVLGILTAINYTGVALSSPAMNVCCDLTGSYEIAFKIVGVLLAIMFIAINIAISNANRLRARSEKIVAEYSYGNERSKETSK